MVQLEIDNSTSKITGLTSIPFNKLRKELSYSIDSQAAFFSKNHFNTTRYCIDKQGNFNTGLLNRVLTFLKAENIKCNIIDLRVIPTKKRNIGLLSSSDAPYPWQLKATETMVKKHRLIISAVTGSGKSRVIAMITAKLNVKTLIVVPSLQIKEQLTADFKKQFKDMTHIIIENIDSKRLHTLKDIDLLLIDEMHHAASKTYQKLNKTAWKGIYYRGYLTATPFRNQTEETLLLEGIAGTDMFKYSYQEAVKQKVIVPIEAYYIDLPKIENDYYGWAEVYNKLVVNNEYRNQVIASILLNLTNSGLSSLCLVKEIRHGDNIASLTSTPFANGQDETTRHYINKFNTAQIKALIGTTGILGEGVDTKPAEYVIIAGLGKAKSAFMQQIGRAIRKYKNKESAKIIIFRDKSHKFCLTHFLTQVKILKEEYGITPIKLELK